MPVEIGRTYRTVRCRYTELAVDRTETDARVAVEETGALVGAGLGVGVMVGMGRGAKTVRDDQDGDGCPGVACNQGH